eukprot:8021100-Karenia_brevis.AAC.1
MHNRCLSGNTRTTNACERFHRRFANFNTGAPHPSVPKFLDMLAKQQRLSNLDIGTIQAGGEKPEKPESIRRNAAIASLVNEYLADKNGRRLCHRIAFHYLE